ncbi:hypothetical protein ASG95_02990 [Phycicoccus sp. Soil803]|nr:hypothetical protein ASG95_02990 [Phycicoccus sp. Soil803]
MSVATVSRALRGLDHVRPQTREKWLDSPAGILAFRRSDVECWLNTGSEPARLPVGQVLLRSVTEGQGDLLPPNSAAWVVTS